MRAWLKWSGRLAEIAEALADGATDGPRRDPTKANVEGMIASSMKERKIEQ